MSAARSRGGLGPSNAAAAPRAFLLIAVAVIVGLVMLWKGLDSSPSAQTSAPATPASTTAAPAGNTGSNDAGSTDVTPTTAAATPTTALTTTTAPPMP